MRWRQIGWTIFLAGLPLSPFLLGPLTGHAIDLWHAHAWWAWLWLSVLVAGSFAEGRTTHTPNPPLAWWVGWIAGWFLLSFLLTLKDKGGYALPLMLGVLHLGILVIAYHAFVQTPTALFAMVFPWMARVGVLMSGYGMLQGLGFDQFFRSTINSGTSSVLYEQNQRVLATIGNPSHFAAYLSCLWPMVLAQRGPQWWLGRGIVLVALLWTRSWGGMLATICVTAWWIRHRPKLLWGFLGVLALAGGWMWWTDQSFFSLSGRWVAWMLLFQSFHRTLLTGAGPGALLTLSQGITDPAHSLYHWRHAHNEYLQVLLEQGVVGLGLVCWMLWHWAQMAWKRQQEAGVPVLTAVFLAFLCNALYNFPAHLWSIGSLGLLGYAGVYARTSEQAG